MEVEIPVAGVVLKGDLIIPPDGIGAVIFVHGSGSSRKSPRNRAVAVQLNRDGFATLLFDLLTSDEEMNRENVFDIKLLSKRLVEVTKWATKYSEISKLPIGYFGASTGAAAALVAASIIGKELSAVVSRGGRVDLAGSYLKQVTVPTLMIVGQEDREVLELNYNAQDQLTCENEIEIIPGATHLFEEPGTLEKVAELASDWFLLHLKSE